MNNRKKRVNKLKFNLNLIKMNKKQKIVFGIAVTLLVVIMASAFSHSIDSYWLRGKYFFQEGIWIIWVIVVAGLGWLWHKIFE